MNGEREESVRLCVYVAPYVPAHVFLCVQCMRCTFRSYANNIKGPSTAGITETL